MLVASEKENKVSDLDEIELKYKDTPLVEHVLFQKFMYYLYEENNLESAKGTAEELWKLFPSSELYLTIQRHLGKDVEDGSINQQLVKQEAEEKIENIEIPKSYKLLGNYPNPFNPSTTISYGLPYNSNVELTIYDITGKVVKVINKNGQSAGYQNIVWHGDNQQGSRVSSGIYFYRFKAASLEGNGKAFEKSAKMLLLK